MGETFRPTPHLLIKGFSAASDPLQVTRVQEITPTPTGGGRAHCGAVTTVKWEAKTVNICRSV